MTPGMSS